MKHEIFNELQNISSNEKSLKTLLKNKTFFKKLNSSIAEKLGNKNTILSLDVFDTLFLRDDSSELERFLKIGERMSECLRSQSETASVSSTDAFFARQLGTRATYRLREPTEGVREGSLKEIHSLSSMLLTGTKKFAEDFISSELKFEAETLTLNGPLLEIVRAHKNNGGMVILLSDMYMHAEHITELGKILGLNSDEFDSVFSSADHNVSKASGKIFKYVEERVSAEPDAFLHLGDSHLGDFVKPRSAGWDALHLPLPYATLRRRYDNHAKTAKYLSDKYGIDAKVSPPPLQ